MGLHEWPLMIFTVLAQSAVGAYWLCTIAILSNAAGQDANRRLEKAMLLIWIFLGIGFLLSSLHLGTPMKAFNAFNHIGSAPLSNEGFFGVLFLACGGLAWLLAMLNQAAAVRKVLLLIGLALSVALIWAMSKLYLMPTVPTWNNWTTPAAFIVTIVLGGAALANLLFKAAGVNESNASCLNKFTTWLIFAGLVGAAIVTVSMVSSLSGIQNSFQSASSLIPDMGKLQTWRFLLLGLGAGIVVWQFMARGKAASFAALGLCAVLVGEVIGRGIFYGLYMTAGLL